jgi:AcrR family transcriptional regulator
MEMNAQDSLRERKKARTRASLREHALRLFREQGYQATTVEQIAAAAEVSPSTFFRYFPTKEDVVIQDDMDARLFAAFERQPPGLAPVPAIRSALREVAASFSPAEWGQLREASELQLTVPEIRVRMLDDINRMIHAMSEIPAKRTGHPSDDLAVQAFVGAMFGVMSSASLPYHRMPEGGVSSTLVADLFGRIDEALGMFEAGLPLLTLLSRSSPGARDPCPLPRHPAKTAGLLSPRTGARPLARGVGNDDVSCSVLGSWLPGSPGMGA